MGDPPAQQEVTTWLDQELSAGEGNSSPCCKHGSAGRAIQTQGDPRTELPRCRPSLLPGSPHLNYPSPSVTGWAPPSVFCLLPGHLRESHLPYWSEGNKRFLWWRDQGPLRRLGPGSGRLTTETQGDISLQGGGRGSLAGTAHCLWPISSRRGAHCCV